MAEGPLIPLEDDIEGDRESTADFIFTRIGDSVPLKPSDYAFDLYDPPKQPLAVSERHCALFLAHSQGFLVAKTKDVFELAKKIKEKGKGPNVKESSVVDVEIGKVSILALSEDSSTLAATVGGKVHFYSVPSLLDKEQEAFFSCSLENSSTIKDFRWQKNGEKSFVLLSNHGALYHGYVSEQLKDVMDNVDAVDWSKGGDSIAVAKKNTLSILSSKFKEQLCFSLLFQSWPTDGSCSVIVDSIKWVRDDSIIIGCFQMSEDGSENGYLLQIITSWEHKFTEITCKPAVFSFPDLFDGFSNDILPFGHGPYLLASYLDCWELIFATNQKNVDQHILLLKWSMDGNKRGIVSLDFKNDKYTPRIDLQENDDDNLILGFGIDKMSLYEKVKIELDSETKELSPRCVLLCLTVEGKVIMYHVARESEPPSLPQISPHPDANNRVNERLSAQSLPESRLVTSRLKDDIKNVNLGNKLKQFNTEIPDINEGRELRISEKTGTFKVEEQMVSAGKDVQESGGSHIGLFAGKISNWVQPSMESAHRQGSGLAVRYEARPDISVGSIASAGKGIQTASSVDNLLSEAVAIREASTENITKNGETSKGVVNATSTEGLPFASQSTAKLFGAGVLLLPSASSKPILSGAQQKTTSNSYPNDLRPSGKPLSLKGSHIEPSPLASNRTTLEVGSATYKPRKESPVYMHASHGSSMATGESSLSGKSVYSRAHHFYGNHKFSKDSEPELSKQFYNVKDMARELDNLLSFIEREGGIMDECTVFQKQSLEELENGLENLAKISQMSKKRIEEQLLVIQQLQNKMLQVSARQVYMEGIVKQASNGKYWDIWNHQKLTPEFELKRQHVLDINQSLKNQLIELERHFNTLEINRFGETRRVPMGRISSRSTLGSSRKIQSLHSVYNTLNSQLAAAEQLSECLSKQMAALEINSPYSQKQNVAKELFESIGLTHELDAFQSPNSKGVGLTPDSIKRFSPLTSSLVKQYPRRNMLSALKTIEPETARRRRDSLDRSWATFEPPKTTAKRIKQEERSRVGVDKSFRKAKEAFDSKMEEFAIMQQKHSAAPASSSSLSSKNGFRSQLDPLHNGIEGKPSKNPLEVQSNSVFKWANNLPSSSQTLTSDSRQLQLMQKMPTQTSSLMASSQSVLSSVQGSTQEIFGSPDISSIGATHMRNQSSFSAVKSFTNSKILPSNQFELSIASQASSKFPSTSSPMKTRPPPEAIGPASKQTHLKSDDARASSIPGSTKMLVSYPESFSAIRNDISLPSVSFRPTAFDDLDEPTSQFKESPIDNLSTESISTAASQPKVSAPSFLSSPFSASTNSASVSGSVTSSSFLSTAFGGSSIGSKLLAETNQTSLVSSSISAASRYSPISSSSLPTPPSLTLSSESPRGLGGSTLGETSQTASVSVSTSAASGQSVLSSSNLQLSESQKLLFSATFSSAASTTESPISHAKDVNSTPNPTSLDKISSKVQPAASEAPATEHRTRASSLLLANSGSLFHASNSQSVLPTSMEPPSSATTTEKDEGLEAIASQEDEMEEEASDTAAVLNMGSLGGFVLGSTPSNSPKLNPFGGSFLATSSSSASSPFTLSTSPGEPFRPASFSLPSSQPIQASQPTNSGTFSAGLGGGFSSFGQPAQLGAGQQALGSVLGTFGQSRQPGAGIQGFGLASSGGFSSGSFSATAGGFASAATGGGFASVSPSGGGFAGAASSGGFASVASGGGGFATAATGGGFAAAAASSSGGGFGAATSALGGFAGAAQGSGFTSGGFGAFGSNQGGAFSAFGGNNASGAGRPPAELFTQMRK